MGPPSLGPLSAALPAQSLCAQSAPVPSQAIFFLNIDPIFFIPAFITNANYR